MIPSVLRQIRRKMRKGTVEGERKTDSNEATRYHEQISRLEELLPGIPNDVTLKQITTKMSWSTLHTLSSVSRTWRQATQSRLIYDIRVHSKATEKFVALIHSYCTETSGIILYSSRERAFYHLPPIPHVKHGLLDDCQCIGFDGKIYILGGMRKVDQSRLVTSKVSARVYMLDLGGLRQWKECSSMQEPRTRCGCAVMDGKIYVFGSGSGTCTSEVYNPNTDSWSRIELQKGGLQERYAQVFHVGEEMFVLGRSGSWAYHPVKLEWRTPLPHNFLRSAPGAVFMRQGKFHYMTHSEINIYDFDTNSWTLLHSTSLAGIAPAGIEPHCLYVEAVRADYGVLVAVISHHDRPSGSKRTFLIQSQRFNSQDSEIVWQKTQCPFPGQEYFHRFEAMCPLQL